MNDTLKNNVIWLLLEFINEIGQYNYFTEWLEDRQESEAKEFVEEFEN